MADTIYHEQVAPAHTDEGSGMWFMLGVIFLIAFLVIAFSFFRAGNWFRGAGTGTGSNVNVPVPEKVDVNVNK